MSFKLQALGLALTSGCLLTTATTITTREPLAPASKSPAIAVQAVKPESEVAKGVVNSPAPQLSSRVATPSIASTPSSSVTESSASSSGAASGSSKAGRPVNAGTVDQVLANILGKKAASSSSAPADERSGDHQALKRGGASSTNTPQRQLPQTGNQGTGLTIAGLGLFAMVGSALKRSWVSQKV